MCKAGARKVHSSWLDRSKYSLALCVYETSHVNPKARGRLCNNCFISEPISYKINFLHLYYRLRLSSRSPPRWQAFGTRRKRYHRHYTSVGHRPRLHCIICSQYLAVLHPILECRECEDRFHDYLQDLVNNGEDYYNQRNPTLLR